VLSRGLVAVLLSCWVASSAAWAGGPESCIGLAIPDDTYIGTLDGNDGFGTDAGMACCERSLGTSHPLSIDDLEVTAALDHSWLGDLVVKIRSPEGTITTLQSRAGFDDVTDIGTGGPGSSADLVAAHDVTWGDGKGWPSAETMGSGLTAVEAACRDNGICDYSTAPDSAAGQPLDVAFDGETYDGTWTFCVGDAGEGDVGTLLNIQIFARTNRRIPCTCSGRFRGGDTVLYSPINTVGGPSPGTKGEVMCGTTQLGPRILVDWNGFGGGHDGEGDCDCPHGVIPFGATSGYWVECSELVRDLPFKDDFEGGNTNRWDVVEP